MNAFWWFKDSSIAGMARPGFNRQHWFDLPFQEAMVLGWFGLRASGSAPLTSIRNYLRDYGAKVRSFHNVDAKEFELLLERFNYTTVIRDTIEQIIHKTSCLEHYELTDDQITFQLSDKRLSAEIDFLEKKHIKTVVTLTEVHHHQKDLEGHFNLHHLAIDDLSAPQVSQVDALADLIRTHQKTSDALVVHCMAGIGRTSTMIVAAHLRLGYKLDELKEQLTRQNPTFKWTDNQLDFIHKMI